MLVRNNKPVAAIVNIEEMERLQRIDELENDVRLLSIALARVAADSGKRYSLDEVLTRAGIDRADLDDDVED